MKRLATFVVCAMLLCVSAGFAAVNRSDFESGLRHYNAGRFPEAVISFSTAADLNPYDPATHYYLANSLAYLKDYQGAFDEYQMCHQLDSNSMYAGYCKVAMQRFAAAARDQEANGGGPFSAGGDSDSPDFIFDGATQELIVLRQTLSLMGRQTMAERDRIRRAGTVSANSRMRHSWLIAARLREDAHKRMLGAIDSHDLDEMDRVSAALLRYHNHLGRMHSRQYMRESAARAAAIETTATNLATQFYARRSRSGVSLQPAGTNLYVRNYEHFEPQALKATAEKLRLPAQKKPGTQR